ncbi:MAG: hypothetical protein E7812_05790 [Phenylobacterium sp.]|nr:MAG: hypothetical protein E7812_05790 [Phenylobacterium sp.]
MLQRLAELAMRSAEDLCARQLAAQTPAEAAALASALHRMSRTVRQTLLLEARFSRDDRSEAREAEGQARADAAEAAKALHRDRKARVRRAMEEVLCERCETQEEVDDLVLEMDLRLDDHIRAHDFETATFEALIDGLCRSLGLDLLADEDEAEADEDADETGDETPAATHEAAFDAAPAPPPGPHLVQMPDCGWAAAPDSSLGNHGLHGWRFAPLCHEPTRKTRTAPCERQRARLSCRLDLIAPTAQSIRPVRVRSCGFVANQKAAPQPPQTRRKTPIREIRGSLPSPPRPRHPATLLRFNASYLA